VCLCYEYLYGWQVFVLIANVGRFFGAFRYFHLIYTLCISSDVSITCLNIRLAKMTPLTVVFFFLVATVDVIVA